MEHKDLADAEVITLPVPVSGELKKLMTAIPEREDIKDWERTPRTEERFLRVAPKLTEIALQALREYVVGIGNGNTEDAEQRGGHYVCHRCLTDLVRCNKRQGAKFRVSR